MDLLGLGADVPLWTILLMTSLILLYVYGSYPMNTWKKLGVPGPSPLPFIGNTHQLFASKKGVRGSVDKLTKKHGKIFGIHYFRIRSLVVTDLEALKIVFVKDFSNYTDRFHIGEGSFMSSYVMKSLFFQNGMDWRRNRRILSPTFTSGKLKLLTQYVNITARQLCKKLEEHADTGTKPKAKSIFGAFSLDVIGGTAFGLNLNSQNNMDGPFFQHANGLFKLKGLLKFAMGVACIFPFMSFILHKMNISIIDEECVNFFQKEISELVLERKSNPDRFEQADFLQLLLKAEMEPEDGVVGAKKLTAEEVISQGILFMMAGFETTSTAMQFTTYLLAKHHEVQDKVVEEIEKVVGDREEVTHEICQNLRYMEAVINETLRMYPPIASINRKALRTTTLKGIPVPADTSVSIHIFNVGRDGDVYEDPDTFNPDRFFADHSDDEKVTTPCSPTASSFSYPTTTPTSNSIAFLPFGFGPRQCIGMRLAMTQMKIALVHMLRRVILLDATPDDLELEDFTGMLSAKVPIELVLAKR